MEYYFAGYIHHFYVQGLASVCSPYVYHPIRRIRVNIHSVVFSVSRA